MPYVIALHVANLVLLCAIYGRIKRAHRDYMRSISRSSNVINVAGLSADEALKNALRRARGGIVHPGKSAR